MGAERLKALLPMVVSRAEGTVRWMEEEDRGGVGGEGGTEAIYVTKMEVGSAGADVDMGFEGK